MREFLNSAWLKLSVVVFLGLQFSSLAFADLGQSTLTVDFDNSGEESNITTPGSTSFSVLGTSWSGGIVVEGDYPLVETTPASYQIQAGGIEIVLSPAVYSVSFVFITNPLSGLGTVTVYDVNGQIVPHRLDQRYSSVGWPTNWDALSIATSSSALIGRVEVSAGIIDHFCFNATEFPLESFVRSDCNQDANVDIADSVYMLEFLFISQFELTCEDACDVNDDEYINIADVILSLQRMFNGGAHVEICVFDDPAPIDMLQCTSSDSVCP